MAKVCKDVKIEPELMPSNSKTSGNSAEKARLDISSKGVWAIQEKTFFDIRVTHPNAASNMKKSLEVIYEQNENQTFLRERVMQVEKASFTPLAFMTTGCMRKKCALLKVH